jgi:tRNA dimethylallyltransferase
MEKLLIICGPTATGKTALAVALARKYNGELINADSRQLYEGLSVVTGKDLPHEAIGTMVEYASYQDSLLPIRTYDLHGASIWLYDLLPPEVPISIALYRVAARIAINNIRKRGKLPILVGGSGLYIRSVVDDIETIDIPPNERLRNTLINVSVQDLQDALKQIDNSKFEKMNHSDKNNARRLVRAIEVAQYYKKGNVHQQPANGSSPDALWIGLRHTDLSLHDAIVKRVESRWNDGAIDEVRTVLTQGSSMQVITSLGVTPIQAYINGKCSEHEAKMLWIKEEIAYAKRQMVWFRKNTHIAWFDVGENTLNDQLEKRVDAWYTKS